MLLLDRVSKSYIQGNKKLAILDECSLSVDRGEFLVIMGHSGCGKSTLLNLISGIDSPSSGHIWLSGKEITAMKDKEITRFRADNIGIIFQFFNLLPFLDAKDNVALPLLLKGKAYKKATTKAMYLLGEVGLKSKASSRPDELSGGEMQRVSIARALVNEPKLILADEPTGNLDDYNTGEVLDLIKGICKEHSSTLLFVTHDKDIAMSIGSRQVTIQDTKLLKATGNDKAY